MTTTANHRFAIFLLIAVFIFVGPIYRQVFDGSNKVFQSWTMFSGIGRGYMDARFTVVSPGGTEERLDRYAVLGLTGTRPADMPVNTWSISAQRGGPMETAARLCKALGRSAVVRVYAREATCKGWRERYNGDRAGS